jgi:hypothetical protein
VTSHGRSSTSQGTGATRISIEMPSISFSATATAAVSATGTPSRRLSVHRRSTSPARAGAIADAANAAIV